MKTVIQTIIFIGLCSLTAYSQIETSSPYYRSKDVKNLELDLVEITKDYTIVTMTYTAPYKGRNGIGEYWSSYIHFNKGYILADRKKYKLKKSDLNDGRSVEAGEDLTFNLYFKRLKPGIENIDICEKRGNFDFYGIEIDNPKNINQAPKVSESQPAIIAKATVTTDAIDVDQNIPETNTVNDRTFALIIGNEAYKGESQVKYAINDCRIFKQYLLKTIGLPENNIQCFENASFGQIQEALSWLNVITKVFKGEAKIIVYYAGHGIPDPKSNGAVILPVDGNSLNPATTIKLSDLYSKLTEFQTQSVVVFLDACFSGTGRDINEEVLADTRGVRIKIKNDVLSGNLLVFTATSEDEPAYSYPEKQHGMFTYFLLKKLQETKGNVTMAELSEYLITKVSQQSIVINKHLQTPQVNVSLSMKKDWKDWEMR